jgi:hypothetical protein
MVFSSERLTISRRAQYIIVRAISADGQRLFISRQPCPFDCQGFPNDYYEIVFPAG